MGHLFLFLQCSILDPLFQIGELQSSHESAVKEVLSQLQETANQVTTLKDRFGDQQIQEESK